MKRPNYQQFITNLLAVADIKINGDRAWDIQVHNDNFYRRVMATHSLGFGESYMAGEWDVQSIDQLMVKILQAQLGERVKQGFSLWLIYQALKARFDSTIQSPAKAFAVGQRHYDLGNDLYQAMLDKRMVYTCAYWPAAKTLDEAQVAKLDLVCRKVGLKPGMRVLDIGGGWGGFAQYAAEKYRVKVLNITVSKEQVSLANERCRGLTVENRLQDYRTLKEKQPFDAVVSLGMFEHVGVENYRRFMKIVHRHLSESGLFLLHTIGGNWSVNHGDAWMNKYIFPGSMLPSIKQIGATAEQLFIMEDWHNFGPDYDKTLMAWHANFNAHWPALADKYGERFYRMWELYLLSSAAAFRNRDFQLWQMVFSKRGVPGGYKAVR